MNRLYLGQISCGPTLEKLLIQEPLFSSQELCKIKKKKKTNSKPSQCLDGPWRHGWVTGLREDVPRQRMWKGRKSRNRIVYVLITEQSSNLPKRFGFSFLEWSDQILCVCERERSGGWGGDNILTPDSEMFSASDRNTMFFCFLVFLVLSCNPQTHQLVSSFLSVCVCVFPLQHHPHPAVKAQTVWQAAIHVSLQLAVFLRKQVSDLRSTSWCVRGRHFYRLCYSASSSERKSNAAHSIRQPSLD